MHILVCFALLCTTVLSERNQQNALRHQVWTRTGSAISTSSGVSLLHKDTDIILKDFFTKSNEFKQEGRGTIARCFTKACDSSIGKPPHDIKTPEDIYNNKYSSFTETEGGSPAWSSALVSWFAETELVLPATLNMRRCGKDTCTGNDAYDAAPMYFLGDTHGDNMMLRTALYHTGHAEETGEPRHEEKPSEPRVFILGDYLDRCATGDRT